MARKKTLGAAEAEQSPEEKAAAQAEHIAAKRDRILRRVLSGEPLHFMEERVAAILNRNPAARDSDMALMLDYWREHEGYDGGFIDSQDPLTYKYTTHRTLARARGTVQNTYGLFKASPEIQELRGTLEEEERVRAREERPAYPAVFVFADESGKGDEHLIVASVWFLDAPMMFTVSNRILEWRARMGVKSEFHFVDLSRRTLPLYMQFVDFSSPRTRAS